MKVLNVNLSASMGKRFNGVSLKQPLAEHGVESKHIVWADCPDDEKDTLHFGDRKFHILTRLERYFSIQSLLHIENPIRLFKTKAFYQSDIMHYHIIHSGYFSLLGLPILTKLKPSVWTLHDPWALTGHCIHPFDCEKWKTACNACPMLETPFEMKRDNTALMFKLKRIIYQFSKMDLIVASKWMLNMVNQSPLLRHARVHHIPFGLDLDFFKPLDTVESKRKLGIEPDTLVICFRSIDNGFKGYEYIIAALEKISFNKRICLLTLNQKGLVEKFRGSFLTVELGWCNDDVAMREAFNASDIFLMPSTAEAFGMMAIEAMACGKPVISFEGTALSEITFAPDPGIAVPMKDIDALASVIQRLIDDPVERLNRGKKGREMAEKHYDIKLQAEHTAKVYQNLLERRRS